jgi:hypothetical protein
VGSQQFNLSTFVRCSAVDGEGFQCMLRPNHDGPHVWGRCEYLDAAGFRCFLPPRHPGRHDFAWFDRETEAGARHTVRYSGTEEGCRRQSTKDEQIFRAHGWAPVSSEFKVSAAWRSPLLQPVLAVVIGTAPRGTLEIVYEFSEQPREPQ